MTTQATAQSKLSCRTPNPLIGSALLEPWTTKACAAKERIEEEKREARDRFLARELAKAGLPLVTGPNALLSRPEESAPGPVVLFALLLTLLAGCDFAQDLESRGGPLPEAGAPFAMSWMALIGDVVQAEAVVPPAAGRLHAYAGVAFYEGVRHSNAERYPTLAGRVNGLRRFPEPEDGPYDWSLVAGAAEARVLSGLLESLSPAGASETSLRRIDSLRVRQARQRAQAGVSPETAERSERYGQDLAEAILAWAERDGYDRTRALPYDPPVGPGRWVPTPPDFSPAMEPYWGRLRPFVLELGTCQPESPPPYSEDPAAVFHQQMREVYEISQRLTEEEALIARFWSDDEGVTGTPPGHWLSIAWQVAEQQGLTLEETAHLFALIGIVNADAFISAWETKYDANYLRPVTAVRRLLDPAWLPFLDTPNFPEYTSGHSVGSGAAAEILTRALGETGFTDRTHAERGFAPRTYGSFREAAAEASISRLYGGIHFRAAAERGSTQGRCVGQAVASRLLPENRAVASARN